MTGLAKAEMSGPARSLESTPVWLVCHTRPRCEKKLAALFAAEKFQHYLPLVESVRHYGARVRRFEKPLFPGYVFVCVAPVSKNRIYQQDLVARALPVGDETAFLRQLEGVRAIVASGLALSLHPLLTHGRRVRVVAGPLQGVEGVVDDAADPQGIVVTIDVLRQGVFVKLPLEQLQPLP